MLNISLDWTKIKSCTLAERNNLLPYIDSLIDLKHEFEKQGIHAFSEFASGGTSFEKIALDLICQGCMPDISKKILYNLLESSNFDNKEYIKNLLFFEYILLMQSGNLCDKDMKYILLSYLGVECAKSMEQTELIFSIARDDIH